MDLWISWTNIIRSSSFDYNIHSFPPQANHCIKECKNIWIIHPLLTWMCKYYKQLLENLLQGNKHKCSHFDRNMVTILQIPTKLCPNTTLFQNRRSKIGETVNLYLKGNLVCKAQNDFTWSYDVFAILFTETYGPKS